MPLSTTANKDKAKATDPNSSLGQDAFLKLLVAQLKYQDPMNPADGADFMAQTAQFTMVEKLAAMQKQGETTIASQKQLQAIQLVGKQVSYTDSVGMLREGVVQSARFTPDGQTLTINGTTVNLSSECLELAQRSESIAFRDPGSSHPRGSRDEHYGCGQLECHPGDRAGCGIDLN